MSVTYVVRYQVADYSGNYSGKVNVVVDDPNTDTDVIIAKAKSTVQRLSGPFPAGPCYQSWKIVERRDS